MLGSDSQPCRTPWPPVLHLPWWRRDPRPPGLLRSGGGRPGCTAGTGDNQERAQHIICMDKFFGIIRGTHLRRGSDRWVPDVCSGLAAQLGSRARSLGWAF